MKDIHNYEARSPLSDYELRTLIHAVEQQMGDPSDAQIDKIIEWALKTRMDSHLLNLVLEKQVTVGLTETGELGFKIAQGGMDRVASLIIGN